MTKTNTCGYCHEEQYTAACPTQSSAAMAEYKKGFQAYDWRHPIHHAYWNRFSSSFMLGYHNAEKQEQSILEAAGNRYDDSEQPQY
ncbi:MAG: hypothetical protein A2830_03060 [Candidatus Taylorbacteria bacterium RIFCSPHIGHO2_01_FULL_44_110]|uniref:Uncharacterized protein n=1 Tax=Candidatus Taylorbacteria bacterium RIFCSPHIGHO2_12_FULL_45_16 TaxID=1802315 RepID=A0A1G2MXT2_9BACT|nr:MAG: hypothetical protein A2830_03060 [Candidatus Taylorbacteria bacterium RIFCSPHIGHO2_01_FULL_44_110]OHA28638.1 MAG: hypothetical protein A3F51_03955 [Candidatus Taylorbacteria bacterium RIFCSPHIGHO2_12_FULL_45_16]OHA32937.1 MAG: hypothetical protein A3A23_00890 [Candidatus Taylorbacteria bacterium RIFCSPLOWO2_01_FULL_45_59]OHA43732.1 MAG: hypothetical protein A3G04_00030 [Candidatus Taylorbacteria bacterium RIFCSPLOWO2_12_FULL_44_9]